MSHDGTIFVTSNWHSSELLILMSRARNCHRAATEQTLLWIMFQTSRENAIFFVKSSRQSNYNAQLWLGQSKIAQFPVCSVFSLLSFQFAQFSDKDWCQNLWSGQNSMSTYMGRKFFNSALESIYLAKNRTSVQVVVRYIVRLHITQPKQLICSVF